MSCAEARDRSSVINCKLEILQRIGKSDRCKCKNFNFSIIIIFFLLFCHSKTYLVFFCKRQENKKRRLFSLRTKPQEKPTYVPRLRERQVLSFTNSRARAMS